MKIKSVKIKDHEKFLEISLDFFKGTNKEILEFLETFPEGLYSDLEQPYDRTFLTHVYETKENLKLIKDGISTNNKTIAYIMHDSSYESCAIFSNLWWKFFDFTGAILL